MRNFQDTFEILKQLFINAFSISMTVPLNSAIVLLAAVITYNMIF